MINTEEMDRDMLARGAITQAEFDANQRMRERQAEHAAWMAYLIHGAGAYRN
jgi:hypothetical protein